MKLRWAEAAVAAVSISLCAVYCTAAATKVWPLIDGDGPAFFPAAVEWTAGRALTNPIWSPSIPEASQSRDRRYVYHGFLYQIVVGQLGRAFGRSARATVAGAYVVHFLVAAVGGLGMLTFAAGRRLRVAAAFILPLSALAFSVAWHGRVEPLALLIVSAGLLAWRWQSPGREIAAGAACALLLFTTPLAGLLAGCVALAALALTGDSLIRGVIWMMAAAAATTGLVMTIYPYPIADWVAGVAQYGHAALGFPGNGFRQTWVFDTDLPLLVLVVGFTIAVAAVSVTRRANRAAPLRRLAGFAACAVFMIGVIRFALVKTEASYNVVVWMPLFTALAFTSLGFSRGAWLLLIVLLLPVAGLGRSAAMLSTEFRADAVPFDEVRRAVNSRTESIVAVTPGLWLAADDPNRVSVVGARSPGGDFFFAQQAKTGQDSPPQLTEYRLVSDRFRPGVTLLGVRVSRTRGGWEYAAYQRSVDR